MKRTTIEIKLNEELVDVILDSITDKMSATQDFQELDLLAKVSKMRNMFYLNDLDFEDRLLLAKLVRRYDGNCKSAIAHVELTTKVFKSITIQSLSEYYAKVCKLSHFLEEHYSELI